MINNAKLIVVTYFTIAMISTLLQHLNLQHNSFHTPTCIKKPEQSPFEKGKTSCFLVFHFILLKNLLS